MALWKFNRAAAGCKALGLNIPIRVLCSPFSSRVSNPVHPQGANVAGPSSTHKNTEDDVVSRRIKKSLDNDDGRDYADDGSSRGEGDVSGFMAEKARKGARKTTETAFNAAGAVAEGMEQTWGAVKETAEKLKDATLGDEHERAQSDRRNDQAAEERLRKESGGADSEWRA